MHNRKTHTYTSAYARAHIHWEPSQQVFFFLRRHKEEEEEEEEQEQEQQHHIITPLQKLLTLHFPKSKKTWTEFLTDLLTWNSVFASRVSISLEILVPITQFIWLCTMFWWRHYQQHPKWSPNKQTRQETNKQAKKQTSKATEKNLSIIIFQLHTLYVQIFWCPNANTEPRSFPTFLKTLSTSSSAGLRRLTAPSLLVLPPELFELQRHRSPF